MDVDRLSSNQDGLITAAQCRSLSIGEYQIRRWLRSGYWSRICRGVYLVAADRRGTPDMGTLIRAAALASGPDAVVTGRSAAILHGIDGIRTDRRIELNLRGDRMRAAPIGDAKLLIHQMVLPRSEVTVLDGIRVTTVVRTLSDLMLSASRYEAVSALDHALSRGMLDLEDLSTMEQIMAGRRGVIRAREWVKQADGRAESVLETRVRLRCLDGGVPPNDLQVEIGAYRVDMLWSRGRLVGEADGRSIHDTPDALFRDRERQNALTAAGFAVIRFTWEDTLHPDRVPMIVRRAFQGRQIDHRGYGHDTPSNMTVTS